MVRTGKILVTGHRGQLGTDLMAILSETYEVIGVDLPELDIRDRDAVMDTVRHEQPQVVIHAAAYTDVDGCESDRETAMAVNSEGTRNVAQACAEIGARVIYYSTDYVFDGEKASAYVEDDIPNPGTVYGQSKLAGERAVQEQVDNHLILRIAWVYGQQGKNFVKTMIRLGQQQLEKSSRREKVAPLRVVDDQFGNPTWTVEICHQTSALLETDLKGVYHSTSGGEVSWYRFSQDIFESLGMAIDVQPCTTEEFPRPAPRPGRSSLENVRLKTAGLNRMRGYHEALTEFLEPYGKELSS